MNDLILPLQKRLYLVIDQHAANARVLQMVAALSTDQRLLLLDCGTRANIYSVAKSVRPLTRDPIAALRNIELSRAFTTFQVLAMFEKAAPVANRPVIVLDFLATFYDAEVKLKEARWLFDQCMRHLHRLSKSAPVMISARPTPMMAADKDFLLHLLADLADITWTPPPSLPAQPVLQPSLF